MIFSLALMCLDTDESNCRLFQTSYETMEECVEAMPADSEALEVRFSSASIQDHKCVYFVVGEPA